ncbi:Cwf21 protein [Ancylostoma caninum]|uniref:Cwf21 protein n=1 Tax=Ancylostoma caninum TaxID=29170 RepID=A0A368H9D0_ANCCA|nr:Cwf21 protein [Ancylostoma caninum]
MYNGIGLQTARGTGTNGYVQANLSNLLLSRKRVEYNSEADLRRAEAEINRAPNEEILQHQRKRVIEMKCAEFEMLMEEKGFDDDEISKKVSDYRKLLLSQLESGELNLDGELDSRDSHARAKAAVQNRDRMRSALGLEKDYIPGSSMKAMKKSDVVGAALADPVQKAEESLLSSLKTELKGKSAKDKKRKKRKQESSSSSSSSSDSSDSSSDSSEDSDSSSDDSDESSSDESVKRRKTEKQKAKKRDLVARERHDRNDKRGRTHQDDSSNKRRRDDDRHESKSEKRRRSRSPSDSSKRRKTRDSRDEDRRRRRRSSSSERREHRSRKQEKSRDRSPARKVKEEPPSPPSEEESRHREKSRQSGSRNEKSANMAFSDDQELIDQIRHDLRMEDYSGVCARCVVPERRRAKFGGLPLNFRSATSSDDEDDPAHKFYCGYEIPPLDEAVFTKEIIEGRLRSRTVERMNTSGEQNVDEKEKVSGDLFVAQEIREISVQATAKVGEVIGYCLYRFYTNFGIALSHCVDDFQLLMADDSGEIELDLPPLDKGRAIGDLGFTVLALVSKKGSMSSESKATYRVVVYLPTSEQFVFELEDLDHTLEWLRDEALRRKGADDSSDCIDSMMPQLDYDLEDVNVFGKPLNLKQSIANSGCTEFVLVRKFSSRGDFHPRGGMFRQKSSALLTPLARTPNTAAFGTFDFGTPKMSVCELPSTSPGGVSPVYFVEDEEVIMSFRVTRLHRVKKNWPGTLSIRFDLFDIFPLAHNRKSFLPNTYQKPISVPWTYLCEVKPVRRDTEHTSILSFTWLPILPKGVHPFDEQITLRQIAQLYEGRTWKTVHIEFESAGKALQAKDHMLDVIRALNSPAYQAYQHSLNGIRHPAEAAESALMQMPDGLLPASSSTRSNKSSIMRKLSKFRMTLSAMKD